MTSRSLDATGERPSDKSWRAAFRPAQPGLRESCGALPAMPLEGEIDPVAARRAVLRVTVGVYLIGLGMLTGVTLDRMRFDRQRPELIGRYEQALREWHAVQMAVEKPTEARRR